MLLFELCSITGSCKLDVWAFSAYHSWTPRTTRGCLACLAKLRVCRLVDLLESLLYLDNLKEITERLLGIRGSTDYQGKQQRH